MLRRLRPWAVGGLHARHVTAIAGGGYRAESRVGEGHGRRRSEVVAVGLDDRIPLSLFFPYEEEDHGADECEEGETETAA